MNAPIALRFPLAHLYQPRVEASPFVRAFIVRDTRRCGLEGDRMLNRFPASTHCAITWFLEGGAELLTDAGGQQGMTVSGCMVNGCLTRPLVSRNHGDTLVFMAVFYPDTFHALFGLDLAPLQNRFYAADALFQGRALEMVNAVRAASSAHERQAIVEGFIMAHAQQHKLPAWLRIRRMGSRVTLGAASRMLGIGPRQLQRLAPREAGAKLQTLLRLKRGERSFLSALRHHLAGEPLVLSKHALDSDYADQSHMARECKAQTGRTPSQLAHDVVHEEADWVYRLEFPDDED